MSNFKSPYRVEPEKEITPKKSWFEGKEDAICGCLFFLFIVIGAIFAVKSDNKRLEDLLRNRANTCEIKDIDLKFKVISYNNLGEETAEAYLDTRVDANKFMNELKHCVKSK